MFNGIRRRMRQFRYAVTGTATTDLLRDFGAIIGENVFIGSRTYVDEGFAWLVTIEDSATLAPGVRILSHDAGMKRECGYTLAAAVRIERSAYVGAGATILPGVTIGHEAVVGAGSVVTHDVPARTVVAGVPARRLRSVDELAAKHSPHMDDAQEAGAFGWTMAERATPAGRAAIEAQVRAAGRAYVR